MYKKLLVPLDGSKLAEVVLPHVEAAAKGCGSPEVILVSVTEALEIAEQEVGAPLRGVMVSGAAYISPPRSPPPAKSPRIVGRMYTQADRYLDRIQERLARKGIQSSTEVLMGPFAETILRFAEKNEVDLIIMASHGRSGLSRWAHGSVAEKVFKASCIPVLMVHPCS